MNSSTPLTRELHTLSLKLFAVLLLSGLGNASFAGNIEIENRAGSNPWFYSFNLLDSPVTITNVRTKSNGTSYFNDAVFSSGYWHVVDAFSDMLHIPLTMELTSIYGEVLTAVNVVTDFDEGSVFDFGSNFLILSDPGSVPEPSTLLLLLTGVLLLGSPILGRSPAVASRRAVS